MTNQSTTHHFDVFLCHNSEDKPAVIQVAEQLQHYNVKPWLDIWELRPGTTWQWELEHQIEHIGAAAVFVGQAGIGPWQQEEIYAFLQEFISRKCPVIPVLLPDAPPKTQLPIFLKNRMWVDFRVPQPDPVGQLIWGITDHRPIASLTAPAPLQSSARSSNGGRVAGERNKGERNKGRITGHRSFAYMATPSPPASTEPDDDLSSEKGIDYRRLRDLLKAGKWRDANQETADRMREAVRRQRKVCLEVEDIKAFPCTDLRTIDQLWVKYSNGHFGFSVQKQIWQQCGSPRDDSKNWDKFCETIGWQVQGNYVIYTNLQFHPSKSLKGELPAAEGAWLGVCGGCWSGAGHLFSRAETCSL